MAKEFFKAHFFPERHGRQAWATSSLNYYLASLFFNAFPLPQREAGTRQTLRYIGDCSSERPIVLIFPEGKRTMSGEINPFRPGIGMIGARLGVPVVPVRLIGLEQVLHQTWKMAKPGRRGRVRQPLISGRRLRRAREGSKTLSAALAERGRKVGEPTIFWPADCLPPGSVGHLLGEAIEQRRSD